MSCREPHAPAPNILIVEDDGLLRMAVADFLRDMGHAVVEATTGEEAVSILQTCTDVDVVFSDVQMPGTVDGLGLARWVRTHRPHVPVLLTSGVFANAEDGVVPKPYNIVDIEARIRRLLA